MFAVICLLIVACALFFVRWSSVFVVCCLLSVAVGGGVGVSVCLFACACGVVAVGLLSLVGGCVRFVVCASVCCVLLVVCCVLFVVLLMLRVVCWLTCVVNYC